MAVIHGPTAYGFGSNILVSVQDQAYFVSPPEQPGPGALLLPAWWGLTPPVRRRADELADLGFTVLAPDLNFGERPATEAEAEKTLGKADPNQLAALVLSSAELLREKAQEGPITVLGFGMGGSLGLWLAVRRGEVVSTMVSFYGSQAIDFAGAAARFQIHLAESDRFISDDEAVFMEATMGLEALDVDVIRHAGTRHGFADPESDAYDEEVASRAWQTALSFVSP